MIENLGVGAAYVFDVLRLGTRTSACSRAGSRLTAAPSTACAAAAGATFAVGLDYQVTRGPKHLAVGVAVRQHFMLSDIVDYPSYTQIFLRAEYVWGF